MSKAFGKFLSRFGNAATVALAGYEIGAHPSEDIETRIIEKEITYENKPESNHNIEIILIGIIILIIMFMAIAAKLFIRKRPLPVV